MITEQWNTSIFFIVYFLRFYDFSLIHQNIIVNMLYFATVSLRQLILIQIIVDCKSFKNKFIYLFVYIYFQLHWVLVAARGLSLVMASRGLLFVAVHGLLTAVASLVAEHGLQAHGLQQLWHAGSVVVVHGLSCSAACGIFPDQGSNLCPLHWQEDS